MERGNVMKKKFILSIMCLLSVTLLFTGCGKKSKNLDLSATEIIDKVYEGLDDLPAVATITVDKDNFSNFFGAENVDFEEAAVSEAMINAVAHSVGVVKLKDGADVEKVKKEIKEKANPRKWVCVEAESVIVESRGNTIILIMSFEDTADKIATNFRNL